MTEQLINSKEPVEIKFTDEPLPEPIKEMIEQSQSFLYKSDNPTEHMIQIVHDVWELPDPSIPQLPDRERILNFVDIVKEEMEEHFDVLSKLTQLPKDTPADHPDSINIMVEYADWLLDMAWFFMSEAIRHGYPITSLMNLILISNLTKVDDQGKVVKDERGKVLKGPYYTKPEPAMFQLLQGYFNNANNSEESQENNSVNESEVSEVNPGE